MLLAFATTPGGGLSLSFSGEPASTPPEPNGALSRNGQQSFGDAKPENRAIADALYDIGGVRALEFEFRNSLI